MKVEKLDIIDDAYSILFLEDLKGNEDDWDAIKSKNAYWSVNYMNSLSKCPPSGVRSIFCIIKKDDVTIAKFLFQYLHIKLKDSFGKPSGEQKKRNFLTEGLRKLVLPLLNFKLLVNGNLLLSGGYGFKFKKSTQMSERLEVFNKVNIYIIQYLKNSGVSPQGILLKDLDNRNGSLDSYLVEEKFNHFIVQPKMKFDFTEGWKEMNDYTAALKSKYRVRFKKAKKSLNGIESRLLSDAEIEKYQEEIYALYLETVSKAGFNLFHLNKNYFSELAQNFGDAFRLYALFKDDQMVAFFTLMDTGPGLDAHYLGYKLALNGKHKLYLNMLYFMVEEAIKLQKKTLHMSRTALEIKSSVGTVPEEVQLYAKHYNPIINRLSKFLLGLIVPKVEWEARHPFK